MPLAPPLWLPLRGSCAVATSFTTLPHPAILCYALPLGSLVCAMAREEAEPKKKAAAKTGIGATKQANVALDLATA